MGKHRKLNATRSAVRYRNPETKRRHFCHDSLYRAAYVKSLLNFRQLLKGYRYALKD